MITAIREVRRAKGMTLDDVARRCDPPTTAQTIGRLEMGTRTVSVDWLNRIAAALQVTASDLVTLPARASLDVAASLDAGGAHALRRAATVTPPAASPGQVAIAVTGSVGDYRAGDEIWCDMLSPDAFSAGLNRDVLVPRGAGRFVFGRLIGREGDSDGSSGGGGGSGGGGKLLILPPGAGSRQLVVSDPPWIARAARLVRAL